MEGDPQNFTEAYNMLRRTIRKLENLAKDVHRMARHEQAGQVLRNKYEVFDIIGCCDTAQVKLAYAIEHVYIEEQK